MRPIQVIAHGEESAWAGHIQFHSEGFYDRYART